MPEQLQKILDRVVEWWKKFSNKQRMLLISLTAVVILALVILGVVAKNCMPVCRSWYVWRVAVVWRIVSY